MLELEDGDIDRQVIPLLQGASAIPEQLRPAPQLHQPRVCVEAGVGALRKKCGKSCWRSSLLGSSGRCVQHYQTLRIFVQVASPILTSRSLRSPPRAWKCTWDQRGATTKECHCISEKPIWLAYVAGPASQLAAVLYEDNWRVWECTCQGAAGDELDSIADFRAQPTARKTAARLGLLQTPGAPDHVFRMKWRRSKTLTSPCPQTRQEVVASYQRRCCGIFGWGRGSGPARY